MLRKVAYYRERLLALADPSSSLSRYVTVRKYIDEKYFAQADFINRHSLSRMDPASHDYANLAYFQARICESLNRREEMKNWFIRSAMADIKTATKDNASLFSVADALFKDGDYARAFKYSSFSLEAAIAFDAKLRGREADRRTDLGFRLGCAFLQCFPTGQKRSGKQGFLLVRKAVR